MKIALSLIAFLFIWAQGLTQEASVREFPMEDDGLLWKIEGDSVGGKAYIFGTMHIIQKDFFLFPKKLEKTISKSDKVVMELPGLPNTNDAMKLIMLKEGSFFDFFNESETDSIINWAQDNLNVDENAFRTAFDKMKPFAVMQLAVQIHFTGNTESYEITIEKIAKEHNLQMLGLETIEEQIGFFDAFSKEEQSAMVMESIRNSEESIEDVLNMQRKYLEQKVDPLYMMIREEGGVIQDKEKELLENRNMKWIPKIKSFIRKDDVFIAVGAAHLGGPNGVIRLLEKEGYTLTPIKL